MVTSSVDSSVEKTLFPAILGSLIRNFGPGLFDNVYHL